METEWITREVSHKNRTHVYVRKVEERPPFLYGEDRPATKAEIADELARRAEVKLKREQFEAFVNRPEYEDAQSIRNALEMMDDNGVLDRLTAAEWRKLRIKICGR